MPRLNSPRKASRACPRALELATLGLARLRCGVAVRGVAGKSRPVIPQRSNSMSSHTTSHRLQISTTFELPQDNQPDLAPASPETCMPRAPEWASSDASPIAPSQRLPLIAHTLREARVAIAELRYEGRGGLGGFITEFHDRHRQKSLCQSDR